MDHIRRGTLALDQLQTLVLDEADEMLRMGFIDDVEWILEHTPAQRQIALFSATMPPAIRRIADNYLSDPTIVKITSKTATASTIRQRVWTVRGMPKVMALTRLLELREHEGVLVFVRTKNATEEVAEQLTKAGFPAAALHGDIAQNQREKIVEKLKSGELDLVVATDVVARGLDVERITHVVNFDIPYDAESYIHRIGRTGRAGRNGDAILFVAPREQRLLQQIERTTRSPIETLELPTAKQINALRVTRLQVELEAAAKDIDQYLPLIKQFTENTDLTPEQIAAATLKLMYKNTALFMDEREPSAAPMREKRTRNESERGDRKPAARRGRGNDPVTEGMQRYWLGVGYQHGVKPGNIVGAIANEAGVDSQYIGRIDISENFSTVDLPNSIPAPMLQILKRARICGQPLNIRPWSDDLPSDRDGKTTKPKRKPSTSRKSNSAGPRQRS